jgi:hypothetical protein
MVTGQVSAVLPHGGLTCTKLDCTYWNHSSENQNDEKKHSHPLSLLLHMTLSTGPIIEVNSAGNFAKILGKNSIVPKTKYDGRYGKFGPKKRRTEFKVIHA